MSTNSYDEEASILLSKNITKSLLVKNAHDLEALKKRARLLEKEKNSEARLFLKKKEILLKRQATRNSGTLSSQRPLSSRSLIPPESNVSRWKSDTDLDRELSLGARTQDMNEKSGRQKLLSPWLPLLSEGAKRRSGTFSSLDQYESTSTSLPDIHGGSIGKTKLKKYSDTNPPRPVSSQGKKKTEVSTSVIDDWQDLRKIRYLRR